MNGKQLKSHLGEKIRNYRKKFDLTQDAFGERIGRNQRQVSLIETGVSFPTPETLTKITDIFNCSMRDLFDFEPIENVVNLKSEIHKIVETMPEDKLKTMYVIGKNLWICMLTLEIFPLARQDVVALDVI